MSGERTLSVRTHNVADSTLVLDGFDISSAVVGYTIRHSVGAVPQVELDLAVFEVDAGFEGQRMGVLISNATRDLLIRCGWTPPSDGAGPAEVEAAQ